MFNTIKAYGINEISNVCLPKKKYANFSELCDMTFQFLSSTLGTASVLIQLGYDRKVALNFGLTLASTSLAVSLLAMSILQNQHDVVLYTKANKKVVTRTRPFSTTVLSFAAQLISGAVFLKVSQLPLTKKQFAIILFESVTRNGFLNLIYSIAKRRLFLRYKLGEEVPMMDYAMGLFKSEKLEV